MGWLPNDLERITTMSGDTLASVWAETFAAPVPEVAPSLLRRALAYERQERKFGGLPVVMRKHLESISADQTAAMPEPPLKLKPGTRLVREWNGTIYTVLVMADGFEFAGRSWRSLSMIARHITGAQWSGPRFFGLKRSGKA
ncbi:DUF2924 domain-containing protein [Alteraurantiacibacter buctensis]|uniref:DUF2924 domain-containing protein n=1 Tax=Alteraurantiacibacter buctensis TaxID=1503981 RepID=A0A844YU22_9SPHN|nr:DUF2924 domain-containing protein [Alteraurantiacibacter buctensis]MXO70602.1 DUF2924 domain-containing protein [Alteraurantiacibacter buctensis]